MQCLNLQAIDLCNNELTSTSSASTPLLATIDRLKARHAFKSHRLWPLASPRLHFRPNEQAIKPMRSNSYTQLCVGGQCNIALTTGLHEACYYPQWRCTIYLLTLADILKKIWLERRGRVRRWPLRAPHLQSCRAMRRPLALTERLSVMWAESVHVIGHWTLHFSL